MAALGGGCCFLSARYPCSLGTLDDLPQLRLIHDLSQLRPIHRPYGRQYRRDAEAGSYLRLMDSCITQLKAQGPSRTCNESQEEEGMQGGPTDTVTDYARKSFFFFFITLEPRVE